MPETLSEPVVLLDNLQDPGNMGSILRSAAAAGHQAYILQQRNGFRLVAESAASGDGRAFPAEYFRKCGSRRYLMNGSSVPVLRPARMPVQQVYELDLRRPVAWLFGHEGQGVSQELLDHATSQVSIPHLGAVESLNVAASAAVCFFEQVRQESAASKVS